MNNDKSNILIVDDMEQNRDLLQDFVISLGYEPTLAENGRIALELLDKQPFDCILLDILMPELDGYKTLEKIKGNSGHKHLPVIMISALDEMDSVISCLSNGADDYLTKPFNPVLLKARLESSLSKKQLHDREMEYQKELEKEVAAKTRELAEAYEKLQILDKAKTGFINLISHEMRTPLNGLGGIAQIMFSKAREKPGEEESELYEIYLRAYERLESIVEQAILLAEIDLKKGFVSEPQLLNYLLEMALETAEPLAKTREVTLTHFDEFPEKIIGDFNLLNKAFSELFKTAVKFSAESESVKVGCECKDGTANIIIESNGYSIPDDLLPSFFDPLAISDSITPGGDLGLGPVVASRVIELFNGEISVKNQGENGVIFTVKLPVAVPEEK